MFKRSSSEQADTPPTPSPSTEPQTPPLKKKAKNIAAAATPTDKSPGVKGGWKPEELAMPLDEIFEAAYKHHPDLGQLAGKLGKTKTQVVSQLRPNQRNFRRRLVTQLTGQDSAKSETEAFGQAL